MAESASYLDQGGDRWSNLRWGGLPSSFRPSAAARWHSRASQIFYQQAEPLIDDIRVTAVPEPAAALLLAAEPPASHRGPHHRARPDSAARRTGGALPGHDFPLRIAEKFGVLDIIDQRETRRVLCDWVEDAWYVVQSDLPHR